MKKKIKMLCVVTLLVTMTACCGFSFDKEKVRTIAINHNVYLALMLHKADVLNEQDIPKVPLVAPEDAWRLILVNAENPLPEDYVFEPITLANGMILDRRAAEALGKMLAQAKADGVDMFVCSAYRTVEYQKGLFQRKINQYIAKGYNEEEAYAIAKTIVAPPSTSEHHTGLAVDIISPSYQVLDEGFEKTDACKWLMENSAEFGFVMRYPNNKSEITGIIYEPWHYRYVGVKEAKEMTEQGITLEEFWQNKTLAGE